MYTQPVDEEIKENHPSPDNQRHPEHADNAETPCRSHSENSRDERRKELETQEIRLQTFMTWLVPTVSILFGILQIPLLHVFGPPSIRFQHEQHISDLDARPLFLIFAPCSETSVGLTGH